MNANLKTTPLNTWHRSQNANMADFGGFDMPLWYETGVKNESEIKNEWDMENLSGTGYSS